MENVSPNLNKDYSSTFKTIIEEITGVNEGDILETAKKRAMADWLLPYLANYKSVSVDQVVSPKKNQEYVFVRGIYSFFLKRKLAFSLTQIGRKIGGRDHSTILATIRKIELAAKDNMAFETELNNLWERANIEFEKYVRSTNKQLNTGETLSNL